METVLCILYSASEYLWSQALDLECILSSNVISTFQGIHRDEMNAGEFPVIGTKEQFLQPGMYSLQASLKLYILFTVTWKHSL